MALFQGTSGNDSMVGTDNDGDEPEAFAGAAGNDTITGRNGDDVVDGGAGIDVAVFRGKKSDYQFSVTVDADMFGYLVYTAQDLMPGRDARDTIINTEFVEFSDGRLRWYDMPTAISVDPSFGPTATVHLFAGRANDTLTGHDGPDRLTGGLGDDVIRGGPASALDINDTAVYVASTSWVAMDAVLGGISANLQTGLVTGAWGNDTLIGVENVEATPYADRLVGDGANNSLSGDAGNDTLIGGGGNDTLRGDEGLDTAVFGGALSRYNMSASGQTRTVSDTNGVNGNDSLTGIERVLFDDLGLAYDLTGNAGKAARLIGVLFDAIYLDDPQVVRDVLQAFDAGYSAEDIATYAINLVYPGYTPTQFSILVYSNLAGVSPGPADVAMLNGLIAEHSMAWLAVAAGDTGYNDANIDLAGLVANGLEFVPF